jgi:hypothetical protein
MPTNTKAPKIKILKDTQIPAPSPRPSKLLPLLSLRLEVTPNAVEFAPVDVEIPAKEYFFVSATYFCGTED